MSDYPAGMTLRPIESWPGTPTENRERSNFSAPWSSTLNILERELAHLSTARATARRGITAPSVLQIAMREQDFRIDGMPRANARPTHPGVILNVESKHGALSYPSDKFTTWQDNLRAIALGLEALRKVDRYGITQTGQQYTGWKQLGSGPTAEEPSQFPNVDAAATYLRSITDLAGETTDTTGIDTLSSLYRRARAVAHPDRGGDRATWDTVEAAGAVLRNRGLL